MKVDSLAKALFFITVRISTTKLDGTSSGGTGFLWSKSDAQGSSVLLVTNRHVVENATTGTITLIEADTNAPPPGAPKLGSTIDIAIDNFNSIWTYHHDPDVDLAVAGFGDILSQMSNSGRNPFFKTISDDLFPSQDQFAELNAIEAVTFVGYPSGLYDTKNGTPIARRGWTATPVALDYGGKPTFLVDAPVFGGSSGSPVFIVNEGMYTTSGGMVVGSRILFLGVVAAVHQEHAIANIVTVQQPSIVYQRLLNLGLVFRSDVLAELIRSVLVAGKTGT